MHAYVTKDRSHPQVQEIYAILETLSRQIKKVGYVPDTNFVLHDVEDEYKDDFMRYHSGKLAIDFGLISTPSGTPIRIVKNLHVCGDCHISYFHETVTKYIFNNIPLSNLIVTLYN